MITNGKKLKIQQKRSSAKVHKVIGLDQKFIFLLVSVKILLKTNFDLFFLHGQILRICHVFGIFSSKLTFADGLF